MFLSDLRISAARRKGFCFGRSGTRHAFRLVAERVKRFEVAERVEILDGIRYGEATARRSLPATFMMRSTSAIQKCP